MALSAKLSASSLRGALEAPRQSIFFSLAKMDCRASLAMTRGVRHLRNVLLMAMFCCTFVTAHAAAKPPLHERVVAVKSDGTITLSSLGNAVLADVVFPAPESAVMWLSEYALQHEISVTAGDEDRYGRTQIRGQLQIDMLNDGAAAIYAADEAIPTSWFEAEARAAKPSMACGMIVANPY